MVFDVFVDDLIYHNEETLHAAWIDRSAALVKLEFVRGVGYRKGVGAVVGMLVLWVDDSDIQLRCPSE